MKPTYIHRIRRKPASSKDSSLFRKEGQQENTFFGTAATESFFQPAPVLQRKCASCGNEENEVQRIADKKEEEKKVQRKATKEEEEEKKVNRKEHKDHAPGGTTTDYIHHLEGKGQALPPSTQQFFARRMGYDFSGVRIHTGTAAAQSAKDINAAAYTYNHHIVFNEGQYNPQSAAGKKLLAHELTHVVQQQPVNATSPVVSRKVNITAPYPVVEDFEPTAQFQKQSRVLGRCDSVLNGTTQLPSLGARNFEKALVKPDLHERNLDSIPRPNLNDASLNAVRANKAELAYGAYGRNVQLIQEALIAWGQGLDEPVAMLPKYGADKSYKGETKSAVIFFQEKHPGLAVDGIVGDLTLAALQQEMSQLTGSIFSIKTVGINNYTGLIHTPPPSGKWKTIVTSTNSFFNNSIDAFAQAELASHFNKCQVKFVTLIFKDAGGVVPSILAHEQVHQAHQLKTINDHLVPWDVDLSIAQLLGITFKAANRADADKQLYKVLGIPDPFTLSRNIMAEFVKDNLNFHQSAAGKGVSTSLQLPSCTQVVFILSK